MPIYEYCCKKCNDVFEEWVSLHSTDTALCPACGAEAKRIISNTSFVLKGSGWYVTDYAKGSGSGESCNPENATGKEKAQEKKTTKKTKSNDKAKEAAPAKNSESAA